MRTPSWVELLTVMVHGPDPEPTFRGVITSHDIEGDTLRRVWRDGTRVRIEMPDGRPRLIVGAESAWQFGSDGDVPVRLDASEAKYHRGGTHLLRRREAQAFLGNDFTRPTGPVGATTLLGRLAWTVELAPPPHKPHPIQLIVDAETGVVLQQRNDGFGTVDQWVEFTVGQKLDAALFEWHGPSRSLEDVRAERQAEFDADMAQRRDWFRENVTDLPLRIEFEIDDVVVHEHDAAGTFHASLQQYGSLARRPRSDDDWELGWRETTARWSDERWDWALQLFDARISDAGLHALKAQLTARDRGPD